MAEPARSKDSSDLLDELRPLFTPRSIAVVGVSQDLWKTGSVMLDSLRRFGFPGRLYAVGGSGGEVLGMPVYRSLFELPEVVDLALLFMPAPRVATAVRECRRLGIPSLVAFAAGFGEAGTPEGRAFEADVRVECDGSFRMVGPNCLGVYCPAGGVTQHCGRDYPRQSGEVAFIGQSGILVQDVISAASQYGFHLSKAVSYGNAVDLNEADLLEYLAADPETRIIGLYIEGSRDGEKLYRLLRGLTRTKPVVVLKGGMTASGARAASSHTGSLAGSVEVWRAMLDQVGAISVDSVEQMLDVLAGLHFWGDHDDPRVGYVCSGGGCSVAASDASHRAGLTLPHMSPGTEARIASFLLPVGTSPSNPVDVFSPLPLAESLRGILATMAASGEVGAIVIDHVAMSAETRRLLNFSQLLEHEDDPSLPELPVLVAGEHRIPVVVVLPEHWDPTGSVAYAAETIRLRRYYQENGVAVFPTVERAFRALGQVVRYNRWRSTTGLQAEPAPTVVSIPDAAADVIRRAREAGQRVLSEHQAKQVLAAFGVPVTKERVVADQRELSQALDAVGLPVVLKIDSPDIMHKTEAGLVRLNCQTPLEARTAFAELLEKAGQAFPTARVNGVIVCEMVKPAVEYIVGAKVDPQLGPAIMCGVGGIFVEVMHDVALRLAPLTPSDVAAMVRETWGHKLLEGARGTGRADIAALEDILLKLSDLAACLQNEVAEVDVNPLMVLPEGEGAVAADALVVLKEP